jgi:hypothetical protein
MLSNLLIAGCLMALCVVVHAVGLTAAFGWLRRHRAAADGPFWSLVGMLILVASWIILLHLVEILFWALLYVWKDAMPDLASALYFSAVTYTTTGYGDVVLPKGWRLVGGVEALTGILMCGWSTGFFFAVVARMYVAPSQQTGPDTSNAPAHQARPPQ